jgi:hypothetical protein
MVDGASIFKVQTRHTTTPNPPNALAMSKKPLPVSNQGQPNQTIVVFRLVLLHHPPSKLTPTNEVTNTIINPPTTLSSSPVH